MDAALALARGVRRADAARARRIRRRQCGECRACCAMHGPRPYVPAPEVNGPCPLLTEAGCSIYARRPETCRQFLCGWRAGLGAESDRPDRCGWMLDLLSDGAAKAAPTYTVRFVATGPHGTMAARDALAARCGDWFRSLPAAQVSQVVTLPWRETA